jgi:hypothetical protein
MHFSVIATQLHKTEDIYGKFDYFYEIHVVWVYTRSDEIHGPEVQLIWGFCPS